MCRMFINKATFMFIISLALCAFEAQAMFARRLLGRQIRTGQLPNIPRRAYTSANTSAKLNKGLAATAFTGGAAFFLLAKETQASLSEGEEAILLKSQGVEKAESLLVLHKEDLSVRTRLFEWAIIRGEEQFAWRVFALGIEIDAPTGNSSYPTLLALTLARNKLDFSEALLERGADPNVMLPLGSGFYPLLCQYVDEPVKMKLLVKYGADVNKIDTFGRSVLWYIFPDFGGALDQMKRWESLDILYDQGLNVKVQDFPRVSEPIEELKVRGMWRFIDQIKEKRNFIPSSVLTINADEKVRIDFWRAVRTNNADSLNEMILTCNISAHSVNEFYVLKRPWLTEAAANGHLEVMEILLKHGAKPNDTLGTGYHPLIAAVESRQVAAAALLLANDANPWVEDSIGRSILRIAKQNNDEPMVQFLLSFYGGVTLR